MGVVLEVVVGVLLGVDVEVSDGVLEFVGVGVRLEVLEAEAVMVLYAEEETVVLQLDWPV